MTFDQILPLLYIFIFFFLIMIFDTCINFFMQNSIFQRSYRYFVAPGIIIHEFSHALAAIITFHKIQKINLFDLKGGYIVHEKTREPISQVIISFAPILGISGMFLFFTWLLQPTWLQYMHSYSYKPVFEIIKNIDLTRWQTWLHLYLSISLAAALAPSRQDFKVALSGIALILLVIFILSVSSLQPIITNSLQHLYAITLFIIAFLTLALLLSIIIYLFSKLLKLNR
ncbi:MAG: M50 family metallopeptidase [bacterium]|nr:M50 family metallopeptidase [bacterium]